MPTMSEDAAAEATRATIRLHATELFAHYGFQKTNIGDIAKSCDMSPGNLYRFYRNKQAIGLAVVRTYFDLVEAAMDTTLLTGPKDHAARIQAFLEVGVQHLVDELERNPKIVELAEFLCSDEQGWMLLGDHIAWKRARLAREIAAGVAAGAFTSAEPEATAATMLNALKAFWMPMTLAEWRDRSTIMPEMRAIVDLMLNGLAAKPQTPG